MVNIDEKITDIKSRVKAKLVPSEDDRRGVKRAVDVITSRIESEGRRRNIKVKAEVEGSIAKDTWIAADRDVDVFIIFPHDTPKDIVKNTGLELAKAGSGGSWRLGYAEHPYVEAQVDGYTVDIVPSTEMLEGGGVVTSVDRTPLHTKLVSESLNPEAKDDVRVLKQFMKGIGVYGAELKVGGFSGYLCELLILNYGSFEKVLKASSRWGERTVIDMKNYYKANQAAEAFDSPLVIIDPVDRRRNAAAAVIRQAYSTFISASRWFLKKPSMGFFFQSEDFPTVSDMLETMRRRGITVVAVVTGCPQIPSDILWGEANKSLGKIVRVLDENGFKAIGSVVWSDENKTLIFLIELEEGLLREGKIHKGPLVSFSEEEESFLKKHLGMEKTLAGPYIDGDRWLVELKRNYTNVRALLEIRLPRLKMSPDIEFEFKKGFQILINDQLTAIAADSGFSVELFRLMRKKPLWLI